MAVKFSKQAIKFLQKANPEEIGKIKSQLMLLKKSIKVFKII